MAIFEPWTLEDMIVFGAAAFPEPFSLVQVQGPRDSFKNWIIRSFCKPSERFLSKCRKLPTYLLPVSSKCELPQPKTVSGNSMPENSDLLFTALYALPVPSFSNWSWLFLRPFEAKKEKVGWDGNTFHLSLWLDMFPLSGNEYWGKMLERGLRPCSYLLPKLDECSVASYYCFSLGKKSNWIFHPSKTPSYRAHNQFRSQAETIP